MTAVEEHVSPDGRLRLLVGVDPDGDLTLGFAGFPWHTRADILASLWDVGQAEAVRRFVGDLVTDRSVVALWGQPGTVRDVWVSEEPARDAAYPVEGEMIELRYWSGRPWAVTLPVAAVPR